MATTSKLREFCLSKREQPLISLQLRVLRLGFLQDGDVGVGVFLEGEEIFVGGFRLGGIACHGVGTTDLKADAQRVVLAAVERFGPAGNVERLPPRLSGRPK